MRTLLAAALLTISSVIANAAPAIAAIQNAASNIPGGQPIAIGSIFVIKGTGLGPANLSIGPIAPHGPNRTERYLDYFFAPDADAGWLEEFFEFDNQVGREDTALVESVHRGMASGLLDHGRLLLASEPLLASFQSWVAARLGA